MTTNKRYGDRLSERAHERWTNGGRRPVNVPPEACGPERMHWAKPGVPVWAWVQWNDGTVEQISTVANGWNDRVVDITVPGGFATVWRSAVRHRS